MIATQRRRWAILVSLLMGLGLPASAATVHLDMGLGKAEYVSGGPSDHGDQVDFGLSAQWENDWWVALEYRDVDFETTDFKLQYTTLTAGKTFDISDPLNINLGVLLEALEGKLGAQAESDIAYGVAAGAELALTDHIRATAGASYNYLQDDDQDFFDIDLRLDMVVYHRWSLGLQYWLRQFDNFEQDAISLVSRFTFE